MRCAILLLVIAGGGCEWVLGLRSISPRSDAPAEGLDSPPADVAIDAPITCPPDYTFDPLTHGHYRYESTLQTTFDQAEMNCEQDGVGFTGYTHLLVIESATEIAPMAGLHWVGLTDRVAAGSYIWVTHEPVPVDISYWAVGEPDNPTTQNCVVIASGQSGGKLTTVNCIEAHGFVCECDDYAAAHALF